MGDTVRRYKPRKEVVEATHEASEEDYQKLGQAVVEGIIHRKKNLVLRFPYFVTFADDFPKGILVKKDSLYNYFKAKTFKLADWLNAHGHLPADAKGIMKAMREVSYLEGRIDKMLFDGTNMLDSNLKSDVQCHLQIEEEQ